MKTSIIVCFVACGLFAAGGCRMCCPSYDYASPTDPGSCNSEYCGNERRGSIFSGYTEVVTDEGMVIDEGEAPEGAVIESKPQTAEPLQAPAIPKPPAPTVKPMSQSEGTQARAPSARRTR